MCLVTYCNLESPQMNNIHICYVHYLFTYTNLIAQHGALFPVANV